MCRNLTHPIKFLLPSPLLGNTVKHFVAKLVKSFGGLCHAAESLDDFRYTLPIPLTPRPLSPNRGEGENESNRKRFFASCHSRIL